MIKIRLFFLFVLLNSTLYGQFTKKYQRNLGFMKLEMCANSESIVSHFGLFLRLDEAGNIINGVRFNGEIDYLEDISDTTYLLGLQTDLGIDKRHIMSVAKDLSTVQWVYNYKDLYFTAFQAAKIKQSYKDGVVFSFRRDKSTIIAKISNVGELLWEKQYPFYTYASEISHSTYLYVTNNIYLNDKDGLVKLDSVGELLWYKKYSNLLLIDIKELPDKDIILSGYITEGNYSSPFLLRLDSDGDVVWAKKWHDEFPSMIKYDEGFSLFSFDVSGDIVGLFHTFPACRTRFVQVGLDGSLLSQFSFPTPGFFSGEDVNKDTIAFNIFDDFNNEHIIVKDSYESLHSHPASLSICGSKLEDFVPVVEDVFFTTEKSSSFVSVKVEDFLLEYDLIDIESSDTTISPQTLDPSFDIEAVFCVADSLEINSLDVCNTNNSIWLSDLWPSDTLVGVPSFPPLDKKGDYYIKHILYAGGCAYSDSVQISVYDPSVEILGDAEICEGEEVELRAYSEDEVQSYSWENVNSTDSIALITQAGLYTVQVEDSIGCVDVDSFYVAALPLPVLTLPADQTICDELSFEIVPTAFIGELSWEGQTASSLTAVESGLYFAQAETVCGIVLDSIEILFKNCSSGIYVPTAFSPNDDGDNDILEVYTFNTTVLEMAIFDRWGNMVYESHGDQPSWDGRFRGQKANNGVYAYRLKYVDDLTGDEEVLFGDITLVDK